MRFLFLLALLAAARPALAQCGAKQPQCASCHHFGTDGAPLCDGRMQWHKDHAFASFCTDCHGGDADATDVGAAHANMIWPLASDGARCETCHPGRGRTLSQAYLAARPKAEAPPSHGRAGDAILASLAVLLAAGGAAFVVHNERRR